MAKKEYSPLKKELVPGFFFPGSPTPARKGATPFFSSSFSVHPYSRCNAPLPTLVNSPPERQTYGSTLSVFVGLVYCPFSRAVSAKERPYTSTPTFPEIFLVKQPVSAQDPPQRGIFPTLLPSIWRTTIGFLPLVVNLPQITLFSPRRSRSEEKRCSILSSNLSLTPPPPLRRVLRKNSWLLLPCSLLYL